MFILLGLLPGGWASLKHRNGFGCLTWFLLKCYTLVVPRFQNIYAPPAGWTTPLAPYVVLTQMLYSRSAAVSKHLRSTRHAPGFEFEAGVSVAGVH